MQGSGSNSGPKPYNRGMEPPAAAGSAAAPGSLRRCASASRASARGPHPRLHAAHPHPRIHAAHPRRASAFAHPRRGSTPRVRQASKPCPHARAPACPGTDVLVLRRLSPRATCGDWQCSGTRQAWLLYRRAVPTRCPCTEAVALAPVPRPLYLGRRCHSHKSDREGLGCPLAVAIPKYNHGPEPLYRLGSV